MRREGLEEAKQEAINGIWGEGGGGGGGGGRRGGGRGGGGGGGGGGARNSAADGVSALGASGQL